MQVNLKEKYTQILTIFKEPIVPNVEYKNYFHELYQKTHNIFTEIEKYYLYKDAVQDESTICQELLMKMEKYHVTELVRHYGNMLSFEENLIEKNIICEKMWLDFNRMKPEQVPAMFQPRQYQLRRDAINKIQKMNFDSMAHSAERTINNIITWCEMIIMLAEIYESKKRE